MESTDHEPAKKKRATLVQLLPAAATQRSFVSRERNDQQQHNQQRLTVVESPDRRTMIQAQFPGESLRTLAASADDAMDPTDWSSTLNNNKKRKKRKHATVWTEAMAVAHILHDEVRDYLTTAVHNNDERSILVNWYQAVCDQLTAQNEWLVENGRLAGMQRDWEYRILEQRKTLVTRKSNMRSLQAEIKELERRAATHQQQSRIHRDATRFLEGLGQLAAATRQSIDDDT